MNSLLNPDRPPVFCPGCTHERITGALDQALGLLNLKGNRVVLVSDIGCSGLFDTFFNTHAFHGLHGRALSYAAGLKLARPELTVIVTMGDGGVGIGGAHFLAACRRNLDLTLLILDNFNFGMTGGQMSVTTPAEAAAGSGFLNRLERPLDICETARAAGAAYIGRYSGFQKDLPEKIAQAIGFNGFSLLDIWGICPGRYTKKNRITPKSIDDDMKRLPAFDGIIKENARSEYGGLYRELGKGRTPAPAPLKIDPLFTPPDAARQGVVLLGNAGQRILTAGEILCIAGMTGGMHVSQKNEYNITVLRGPSVSEVILSKDPIEYTGIEAPSVILAVGQEGVLRRKVLFEKMPEEGLVLAAEDIDLPTCPCEVLRADFKGQKIGSVDRALASLGILAKQNRTVSLEMLKRALEIRFGDKADASIALVERAA
ncbi:MAG: 2-oxoacid:acceptor oxidoreductase family protein [Deltaproteobacteria bacterium]|nr:2-oxoacid:acceptor oxidoreductase family protein [Deltaproteobacteria bacterium]